jgi:hypothetical protein
MSLKKIWYFIWREDSWSSWVVNVVLAIIIVKFLIYPGLGLLLGTNFPVVAVVSCSMQHHEGNCWPDAYMKSAGSLEDLKRSMAKPKVLCGLTSEKPEQSLDYWEACGEWYDDRYITQEDFKQFPQNNGFSIAPIIHRVVSIKEEEGRKFYKTKGDYNERSYAFEESIGEERIHGKVLLKVPYLGWVKMGFNMLLKMVGVV